jgi:hypothetical protein
LSAEPEESPLLEAITREWLVKTQQAGKDFACAVVICKVWKPAVALQLLVVPSSVYEWSIHPIQIPTENHTHKHDNITKNH